MNATSNLSLEEVICKAINDYYAGSPQRVPEPERTMLAFYIKQRVVAHIKETLGLEDEK